MHMGQYYVESRHHRSQSGLLQYHCEEIDDEGSDNLCLYSMVRLI